MRGGKFPSVNNFSAQEHASSESRRILNFRIMAVRDMKLRTCLSKNVYLFSLFRSLSVNEVFRKVLIQMFARLVQIISGLPDKFI